MNKEFILDEVTSSEIQKAVNEASRMNESLMIILRHDPIFVANFKPYASNSAVLYILQRSSIRYRCEWFTDVLSTGKRILDFKDQLLKCFNEDKKLMDELGFELLPNGDWMMGKLIVEIRRNIIDMDIHVETCEVVIGEKKEDGWIGGGKKYDDLKTALKSLSLAHWSELNSQARDALVSMKA